MSLRRNCVLAHGWMSWVMSEMLSHLLFHFHRVSLNRSQMRWHLQWRQLLFLHDRYTLMQCLFSRRVPLRSESMSAFSAMCRMLSAVCNLRDEEDKRQSGLLHILDLCPLSLRVWPTWIGLVTTNMTLITIIIDATLMLRSSRNKSVAIFWETKNFSNFSYARTMRYQVMQKRKKTENAKNRAQLSLTQLVSFCFSSSFGRAGPWPAALLARLPSSFFLSSCMRTIRLLFMRILYPYL